MRECTRWVILCTIMTITSGEYFFLRVDQFISQSDFTIRSAVQRYRSSVTSEDRNLFVPHRVERRLDYVKRPKKIINARSFKMPPPKYI